MKNADIPFISIIVIALFLFYGLLAVFY